MNLYERVDKLRELMAERDIEAYIIPTSDPHQSEYVADFYKTREFISGFTGSQGTAVITHDKAGLWTDGRYFVQAEHELKNSPCELYRMGEDITFIEFLKNEVSEFGKVGVDGKTLSLKLYEDISEELGNRLLITDIDFISDIWEDRPELPKSEVWIFDEKYTGMSLKQKVEALRNQMKKDNVEYTFIGALEDIAYLLNLRGDDIYATPVFFSYAVVSEDKISLFINENKLDIEVRAYLEENHVDVYEYDYIFEFMNNIKGTNTVYVDPNRTNVLVYQNINKNVKIKKGTNYTTLMKAIKTDIEIENFKIANQKDSVAIMKFFSWLEAGVKSGTIDEIFAAKKLLDFKEEQENFIEVSFGTISAYGSNAAMPHYDPEKNIPFTLKPKGLYLLDNGSQYLEGTTDITRTIALGELTAEEIRDYTLTVKSHIQGMSAKFKRGCTGVYLDSIVRDPLYRNGIDFNHGTGHGVGFVLGVHEGPMSISRKDGGYALKEGMVFSIEPGIYIEGSHGIRIESVVFVKKAKEDGYLEIESLLYLPIDTRPIDKSLLEDWEIEWLNNYNKKSYELISKDLEGDDLEYLKMFTKEI